MAEYCVVVRFNRRLPRLRATHDDAAGYEIEHAQHEQHRRQPEVQRQRGRDHEEDGDGRGQMLPHEFQPEAEQRIHGAHQRVDNVRGAVRLMPGKRHGDDALEGIAHHLQPAPVGEPVGPARHQYEGEDVEDAERSPRQERGSDRLVLGHALDDPAEQNRFRHGDEGQHDVRRTDEQYRTLGRRKIAQRPQVDFDQRHSAYSPAGDKTLRRSFRSIVRGSDAREKWRCTATVPWQKEQ